MIKPIYKMSGPNETISLRKIPLTIRHKKNAFKGKGEITLQFLPSPQLKIIGELNMDFFQFLKVINNGRVFKLESSRINIKTDILFSSFKGNLLNSKTSIFTATPPKGPIIKGSRTRKVKKIIFHLVNFWNFHSEVQVFKPTPNSSQLIGHSKIIFKDWELTLDGQPNTKDICEKLKSIGGYGITHVGCIKRKDKSSFNLKDVEGPLKTLSYFFSFLRGFRTSPILSVGFNKKNVKIFEIWHSPNLDPFPSSNKLTWFEDDKCKISQILPRFWNLWQKPVWEHSLNEIIGLYLTSNYGYAYIDGSIPLSQIALELLSWNYLVQEKKMLDSEGFNKLSAAQNLKLLLSVLQLPTALPKQLQELKRIGRGFNWKDGPQAFIEIRNSIVHPNHKQRGKFEKGYFEAWNLGQWYIELILLRLIGYTGEYKNRLILQGWKGTTEPLPSTAP